MKVLILAGGLGTRITEESHLKPKPMIEIGEMPIVWHIMKYFSHYGHNEFIILAGYKQYVLKEFFNNYYLHTSDVSFDFSNSNKFTVHKNASEPWKVTVVNTGLYTQTAGRLLKVKNYIGDEPFFLTYGDGLSDVNLDDLLKFHEKNKKMVTITAIQPGEKFGKLDLFNNEVISFKEKNIDDGGWINGGFMMVQPTILKYIKSYDDILEKDILPALAQQKNISAYKHNGFWQCMDTLRDKILLEDIWNSGEAKWKKW